MLKRQKDKYEIIVIPKDFFKKPESSHYLNRSELCWTYMFLCNRRFITCNFQGQHDDARMNLAIALTAVRHGASVANHVEVLSLLKRKGRNQ